MTIRETRRVLDLYPYLSFRDRTTILARLVFNTSLIMNVLEEHLPERGSMLDIGCGYGIISHLLSAGHPGRSLIGVDISSHRIEIARRSIAHKKNMHFHAADIREFQLPHCNAIIMIDILYMLKYQEQEQLLYKCHQNLEDNGTMIIKDTRKSRSWKYAYTYTEEKLKARLRVYGGEVKRCLSQYWTTHDFLELLESIGFCAEAIPLRSYLPYPEVFYICQKKQRA